MPESAPTTETTAPRPLLRGVFHACAAVAAIGGIVLLVLLADSASEYVGGAGFASSLLLIAGTYPPFCLVVLDTAWGISMLSVVWGLAGAGVAMKLAWPNAPRWLSVRLYLAARC